MDFLFLSDKIWEIDVEDKLSMLIGGVRLEDQRLEVRIVFWILEFTQPKPSFIVIEHSGIDLSSAVRECEMYTQDNNIVITSDFFFFHLFWADFELFGNIVFFFFPAFIC